MSSFGVIDLGSNTFHLLIVETKNQTEFQTIFRKRVFTGLSDGGIDLIKEERITYGIETITDFKNNLDFYNCNFLKVIGTAVLRSAKNRKDFIVQAEKILGTPIDVIDGMQEADYIYNGITLLPEANTGTHLIMDIGGGSTEFILIKDGKKLFSKSYILGVGSLHELFNKSDPISKNELTLMANYITKTVSDLIPVIKKYSPDYLTGASGSFEVLQLMSGLNPDLVVLTKIEPKAFNSIYDKVVSADAKSRENLEGLPIERVKLIVVGMVLKKTIFELVKPKYIMVSPYALKEGVIKEMITNEYNSNNVTW